MARFRPLALFFTLVSTLLLGVSAAQALPPGGAATSNTPGTNSTVSPTTLRAGDTLKFKLTGFPANEQVYVKVDDGEACPADSAQGACVVHQQKSDANGTVEGSFVLSKDLAEGEHTLRFLATEIKRDSSGNQIGTEGYSNRSPVFTISGVNENSSGGTTVNVDPEVINGGSDSGSSSNNSADNSNSSDSSGNSGSNSSGNSSGSNSGTSNSNSDSSNAETTEETVYLDADGNQISKEEYEALMADSDQSAKPSTSAQAKSSASASASATAEANKDGEVTEATSAESDSGSDFPWIGVIALVLALAVAGGVLLSRRKKA